MRDILPNESACHAVSCSKSIENSADYPRRLHQTNAPPYFHPINVQPRDIDFMGHVNNATYLTWVQDAVIAHWRQSADAEAIAADVWVAVKHEIIYRKPAYLNDKIMAIVLLEQVRRESAFYETIIRRGDIILAHVKSRWCCLDSSTLRPVRLNADQIARFLIPVASD